MNILLLDLKDYSVIYSNYSFSSLSVIGWHVDRIWRGFDSCEEMR